MKNNKKLAIYLDHASAFSIEYTNKADLLSTVELDFDSDEKKKVLQKGESHLHNMEQHLQQQFYEDISNSSLGFSTVVLFGPTTAKAELKNILTNDNRFSNVDIILKNTDKLNPKEQITFVNNLFNTDTK